MYILDIYLCIYQRMTESSRSTCARRHSNSSICSSKCLSPRCRRAAAATTAATEAAEARAPQVATDTEGARGAAVEAPDPGDRWWKSLDESGNWRFPWRFRIFHEFS